MRTTIDKAGRIVIPRQIREAVGLVPGEVEVAIDGDGVRIEPIAGDGFERRDGLWVIPASGAVVDDDTIRTLRDAGRR